MKIENYEGTADAFTFPHNSRVVDISVNKFIDQRAYNYSFTYFGVTKGIKSTTSIVINGFFDDSGTGNKVDNIRDLFKHCNDNKLKKFYFSDDYFYIVIPQQPKVTYTGGRTMFRDYVASFISPFGILFSTTQKDGIKTDSDKNAGNVFTPIEKIITTSATSGTTYNYKDKDGNGFSIVANASGTLTVYLIKLDDLGNDSFFTEFFYAEIGTTKQVVKLATEGKSLVLGLDADETLATRFNTGSASVPANTTFYFRDGYSSE
jgi:hypothetical protein